MPLQKVVFYSAYSIVYSLIHYRWRQLIGQNESGMQAGTAGMRAGKTGMREEKPEFSTPEWELESTLKTRKLAGKKGPSREFGLEWQESTLDKRRDCLGAAGVFQCFSTPE
jgi:hypothetical protein